MTLLIFTSFRELLNTARAERNSSHGQSASAKRARAKRVRFKAQRVLMDPIGFAVQENIAQESAKNHADAHEDYAEVCLN